MSAALAFAQRKWGAPPYEIARDWRFYLLWDAAEEGAQIDAIRAVAEHVACAHRAGDDLQNMTQPARRVLQLRRLLGFVQGHVRYQREAEFRAPIDCIAAGVGDCKSSATLLCALAVALGCDARLVALGLPVENEPCHVACQLRINHEAPWWWAEATLPALLGEHPEAAAARLGLTGRRDLGR